MTAWDFVCAHPYLSAFVAIAIASIIFERDRY